jgi:methane monooxygenase PmoA-like
MKFVSLLVVALGGSLVGVAQAQGPPQEEKTQLEFSVTGTTHDLTDVIVHVPVGGHLAVGLRFDTHGSYQISRPRLLSNSIFWDSELTMVLKSLKANERKTFAFRDSLPRTFGSSPVFRIPENRFRWKPAQHDQLDLLWVSGGKGIPVLRYMFAPLDESNKDKRSETFKPYHQVFALDGETLLTKGTGGLYPHHRGLFFGFNKVTYDGGKKADVWHCTGDAYESHESFDEESAPLGHEFAGQVFARQRVRINWHGEKKEVFAEEEREMTVYAPHDNGMLIEFASIVRPKLDNVRLDGDPQHSGFHFRANNEVAEQFNAKKPETYFLRPDGKGKIGEERNWDPKTKKGPVNLPWDAMSFTVGGKRYTALYLDHPDNPKEARGSERVYGRIGSYFEYNLTKDKPLRVQYRLWIQEGEMTVEQCEAMSRAFTEPVSVVVK